MREILLHIMQIIENVEGERGWQCIARGFAEDAEVQRVGYLHEVLLECILKSSTGNTLGREGGGEVQSMDIIRINE